MITGVNVFNLIVLFVGLMAAVMVVGFVYGFAQAALRHRRAWKQITDVSRSVQ